jgi:hypothetical protein
MQINQNSYNQLLTRHSIRRYDQSLLSEDDLSNISKNLTTIDQLDENNRYEIKSFNYLPDSPSGKALGGFGRIMKPPHYFAPFISGGTNSLVDLGFRTQQIVLEMWKKGIGSCYIGCAHHQNHVKKILNIADQARIISFVIFGRPDTNQTLRLYQKLSQFFTRSKKRLSFEELFIDKKYLNEINRNTVFKKILEAGRQAPSATNAQPWRFESNGGRLIIYAQHKRVANIYDLEQSYSFHDTGICMANMSEAAIALGKKIRWQWINADDNIHQSNDTNIPIAYFSIYDLRSQS